MAAALRRARAAAARLRAAGGAEGAGGDQGWVRGGTHRAHGPPGPRTRGGRPAGSNWTRRGGARPRRRRPHAPACAPARRCEWRAARGAHPGGGGAGASCRAPRPTPPPATTCRPRPQDDAELAPIQRAFTDEMMATIFARLGPYGMGVAACACRQWRYIARVRALRPPRAAPRPPRAATRLTARTSPTGLRAAAGREGASVLHRDCRPRERPSPRPARRCADAVAVGGRVPRVARAPRAPRHNARGAAARADQALWQLVAAHVSGAAARALRRRWAARSGRRPHRGAARAACCALRAHARPARRVAVPGGARDSRARRPPPPLGARPRPPAQCTSRATPTSASAPSSCTAPAAAPCSSPPTTATTASSPTARRAAVPRLRGP